MGYCCSLLCVVDKGKGRGKKKEGVSGIGWQVNNYSELHKVAQILESVCVQLMQTLLQ